MSISPFIRQLREKVGHDLLHLVGVSAVVLNERGQVLLVKSADHGQWMPIGGMVEPGEEPADAAVREVREEAGVQAAVERAAGVFDGPRVTYPNGDRVHYITLVFRCRAAGGEMRVGDEENTAVDFFPATALPPMRADHQRNVMCALVEQSAASFVCQGEVRPAQR